MTSIFYNIIQIAVVIPLAFSTLYIFIFALAGLFYKQPIYKRNTALNRIVVLIPGYKEDETIIETVKFSLLQTYPKNSFDVVVIADSFLTQTIQILNTLPIRTIEVIFENRTKAKALTKAMEQLDLPYDIVVVLDADNLMSPDFLSKINDAYSSNFKIFQGRRKAKNVNTPLAVLDALSEEINNHIFRKGHRVLGLPSALTGSGMAFQYDFFKTLMKTVTAVGGFDKEIELKLLKNKINIEYLNDAVIFDEKTENTVAFTSQRRRWLAAQFHYFRHYFADSFKTLLTKRNFTYFNKTVQFIQPPRILLLAAILILGPSIIILNIFIDNYFIFNYIWSGIITLCLLSFLFSIPRTFYNISTLKALIWLPKGMLLMLKALLRIKGANDHFIHTKHSFINTKYD